MVITKNSHVFKKKQESKLLGILISYIYIYTIYVYYIPSRPLTPQPPHLPKPIEVVTLDGEGE